MKPFHVYLLRCADGSYYCGHTDNIDIRMQQHHVGDIGYTATRKPLALVWQGEFETREGALAFELKVKGWSRAKKEALIAGDWQRVGELARSRSASTSSARTVGGSVRTETEPVRPEPVEGHPALARASTSSARTEIESASPEADSAILSVNVGSSSLKFAVYPVHKNEVGDALLRGQFEGLEPGGQAVLRWHVGDQTDHEAMASCNGDPFAAALQRLQLLLQQVPGLPPLRAVAHRVVHGGEAFTAPVQLTPDVLHQLEQLNGLAPLHQPHNLAGIRAFARAFPQLPQIACFDTAFHATVPALHSSFALPGSLTRQGVRRYGFHGLSYQFIMGQLQQRSARADGRVLMAHLGNGASLCAAQGGRSVATTMGFSALDGLMMGTRSGSLDPGVLLHLMAQGWDHDRIEELLYRQSGLLGVSGISADMRALRQSGSEAARFAIDLFTHRVVREAGAMAACLQGLDLIAFSGGIGEHDAALRQQVCAQLAWLGVHLDEAPNQAATGASCAAIHSQDSTIEVWVIPTDEGQVAAELALERYGASGLVC
jgi:acetate kinase